MRSYLKKKKHNISTLRIGKKNRVRGLENKLIARKYKQKCLFHALGYDLGNLNNQKIIQNVAFEHKPEHSNQNLSELLKLHDV